MNRRAVTPKSLGSLGARLSGFTRVLSILAVVALLVAGVLVFMPGQETKQVTASFPRTVSLYEGSEVRILGVPVGSVESVTPSGTDVRVTMSYDAKYEVPADAKAVIVSPAIVGDRFVQLTPVYKGGNVLADGATLAPNKTATPLELDEIYQSIDDLSVALGPEGANSDGALTRLLDSTARNFAGEGKQFHQTVQDLGKLTSTLDDNKEELFGSVRQVQRFVGALAKNDRTVRRFNQSLSGAADLLDDERKDLAAALRNLSTATKQVSSFVRENRAKLSENIKGLTTISQVLVKQRDALDEILSDAPLALNNLYLTYNVKTGTLDTRANIGENITQLQHNPAAFLCSVLLQSPGGKQACNQVKKSLPKDLDLLRGGASPLVPDVPSVNRPGTGKSAESSSGKPAEVEHVDRSLAGLVRTD